MNISCDIVRDLLPLYHDNVCSDDSKALVSEHLKGCDGCTEELRLIDEELNAPHITPENKNSITAISGAWKKAKKKSFVKGIAIAASVLVVITILFNLSFSIEKMKGMSMSTSISDGDTCLFSKLAFSFGSPEYDDIILAEVSFDGRKYSDIVRVVAVSGDTVLIEDGTLYINGEASTLFREGTVIPLNMDGEITLGDGEYFVMGDNQAHSTDSRSNAYGLIPEDSITGKFLSIIWSPSNPFKREVTVFAKW